MKLCVSSWNPDSVDEISSVFRGWKRVKFCIISPGKTGEISPFNETHNPISISNVKRSWGIICLFYAKFSFGRQRNCQRFAVFIRQWRGIIGRGWDAQGAQHRALLATRGSSDVLKVWHIQLYNVFEYSKSLTNYIAHRFLRLYCRALTNSCCAVAVLALLAGTVALHTVFDNILQITVV